MARGTGSSTTSQAASRSREGSSSKPLLLLDVDGVLCLEDPAPDYRPVRVVHGATAWISERNKERLDRLAGAFELVWATSWEERANTQIAPLVGVSELPVLRFKGGWVRPGWNWKLSAVRGFVGDRPTAWLDDELDFDDVRSWAAARTAPTLLVSPSMAVGLTDDHVQRLLAFAAACANPV